MTRVDVPLPLGGLYEDSRFAEQPAGYTRDEQNVRAQDPRNGRARIAQRPGLTKFTDEPLEGGFPVEHMQRITVANRKVQYNLIANPSTNVQFEATLPSFGPALVVRCDNQGNAWTVDGDGVLLVYTADGTEVARAALPVPDPLHQIRALWVTPQKQAYIGISAAGSQGKARLWKYGLNPDKELVQLWELGTEADAEGVPDTFRRLLSGYVEDCRERNGFLYTVQNDVINQRSFVVAYEGVNSAVPEIGWVAGCAYPVNSLAVNDAGEVYASSPANTLRGNIPGDPNADPVAVDWTPDDLGEAADNTKRLWAWLRASDLDLADGDPVNFWSDASGGGRDLFVHDNDEPVAPTAPTFRTNVISGRPAIQFSGERGTASGPGEVESNPGLMSSPPFSDAPALSAQQRNLLPSYTGAQFALFMVVKLNDEAEKQCLVVQGYETGTGQAPASGGSIGPAKSIIVNKDPAGAAGFQTAAGVSAGRIVVDQATDTTNPAHGGIYPVAGGNTPRDGSFTYAYDTGTTSITFAAGTSFSSTAVDFEILGVEVGDSIDVTGTASNDGNYTVVSVTGGSPSTITTAEATASEAATGNERVTGQPNPSRVCVLTWIMDGGDPDSVGSYSSRWRINGRDIDGSLTAPADFYNDQAQLNALYRTYVGNPGEIRSKNPTINVNSLRGHIAEIVVVRDAGNARFTVSEDEMEQFEGYLAWAFGRAGLLPTSHPYNLASGPPSRDGGLSKAKQLLSTEPLVAKFGGASGTLKWVYTGSGVGWGTAWSDGTVFTTGPRVSPDNISIRGLVDSGNSVEDDSTNVDAWSSQLFGGVTDFDYTYQRLDTDKFNNVYIPWYEVDEPLGTSSAFSLFVYSKTGQAVTTARIPGGGPDAIAAHAVAHDPVIPEYGDDLPREVAQHVYLATVVQDAQNFPNSIYRMRLVRPVALGGAARRAVAVGIANGNFYEFDGVTTRALGATTVANQANLYQSTVAFGKAYFTDGRNYRVYDPLEADSNERVQVWKATNFGQIPANCQLLTTWAGRVVLARSADSPNAWFLSKNGDPEDWDTAPPVPRADQAVAGSASFAGPCPDSITSLIPYSDDFLIMGCDASIWRLVGNPVEGGVFENITQDTGVALGSPWARDPDGTLYFFGSTGGVYRMAMGASIPQRISRYRIEADLSDVDLNVSEIRMVWDKRGEGLWIIQTPRTSTDTILRSWFYDQKRDGWHRDLWGSLDVQPHSVIVLDGDDPDDRLVLFGCRDGYVRKVDYSANSKDDDGNPIVSEVLVGPIQPDATGDEWGFTGLHAVLARGLQGCQLQWFGEEDPEELGPPKATATLHAGLNNTIYERVRGSYCYVKLRSEAPESTWALESLAMDATRMGGKRRLGV